MKNGPANLHELLRPQLALSNSAKAGFSLIELLIVMVIIGLALSVGIANFRDFGRRQEVDNVSRMIQGDLRLAQNNAAAGKVLPGCIGAFDGYRVEFSASGAAGGANSVRYSIYSTCRTGPNATNIILSKTVDLPANIFVAINRVPSSGIVSVLFKPLERGTDVVAGNNLVLTVSHNLTAQRAVITVNSAGEIR